MRVKKRLTEKATKYFKKYPSLWDQYKKNKDNLDVLCEIYKSASVSRLSMKSGNKSGKF